MAKKIERKNPFDELEKIKQRKDDKKVNQNYPKADNYEIMIKKKKAAINLEPENVSKMK